MKITAKLLAKMLDEELAVDNWGDIEPHWFYCLATGYDSAEMDCEEAEAVKGLEEVLERVAARLQLLDAAEVQG